MPESQTSFCHASQHHDKSAAHCRGTCRRVGPSLWPVLIRSRARQRLHHVICPDSERHAELFCVVEWERFVRQTHETPQVPQPRPVQSQSVNRRPPLRCERNDLLAVGTPVKMFRPAVSTRIKQQHLLPRHHIPARLVVSLQQIAAMTGAGEVFSTGSSATRQRHDVLSYERTRGQGFRALAVFTAKFRPRENLAAQFL